MVADPSLILISLPQSFIVLKYFPILDLFKSFKNPLVILFYERSNVLTKDLDTDVKIFFASVLEIFKFLAWIYLTWVYILFKSDICVATKVFFKGCIITLSVEIVKFVL